MNNKTKIALIYVATALFCAVIIKAALWVRTGISEREKPYVTDTGAEKRQVFFPIQQDFMATNQMGDQVKLSSLKGKVWLVCEFFAVCPQCAMRNGAELREIIDTFGSHPDFQLVCVSIDPMEDSVEKIAEYAAVLHADAKNWWFLSNGDTQSTHDFMEKTMKFFTPKLRTDPADIESNGKYAHDLGLALVNRNFEVVGKWPLAESRDLGPARYQEEKSKLYERIRTELDRKP
jgi:cytochrome oxidase Cu insertion factor (SCO1/SenC/PrrC family)